MQRRRNYALILPLIVAFLIPISFAPVSAAIPCIDQEALQSAATSTIPEHDGPRTLEELFSGSGSIPNEESTPAPGPIAPDGGNVVRGATENLVRCLLYRDYERFSTLVTGEYRVNHLGATTPETTGENFADIDSLILLNITSTWSLPDDRAAGNVELLVNGNRLLLATLIFVEHAGTWYLDDSAVISAEDVDTQFPVQLHATRIEPRWLEAESSDVVSIIFNNQAEVSFYYALIRLDAQSDSPLAEGLVVGWGYAGPPDDSVLVLHDLEAGRYRITFLPDGAQDALTLSLEIMIAAN